MPVGTQQVFRPFDIVDPHNQPSTGTAASTPATDKYVQGATVSVYVRDVG